MMKQFMRRIAVAFAVLALCMPIGLMVVYLLYPLWAWLEGAFGVEAVGHGGPAAWCYLVVYVTLVVVGAFMIWIANRKRPDRAAKAS